jgi:hypothetical protein
VAAVTSARPPGDSGFRTAALTLGKQKASVQNKQAVLYYTQVQSNYFGTLGISLLLGRGFEAQTKDEHVAILSESAANELWPGQNPVGRSLRLGGTNEQVRTSNELVPDGPVYQVVGVARDVRGVQFDGSDSARLYLPLAEDRVQDHPLLIRTKSDPAQVIRAMDPLIASVDPALIATCSTLHEALRWSAPFITSTFAAGIASSVGLLGLLLALLGIYGTVNYIVLLRTREVGIRMAIGAQKRDVLGLILRESTRPVMGGLAGGMILAVGASYVLRQLLYGISRVDGISFIGVSLSFLAIALIAAYPPSRRAMRVDPMVALRYE